MFLDIEGNTVFALGFGQAPRTFLAHGGWISNFEDWIDVIAPLSSSWRATVYATGGGGDRRIDTPFAASKNASAATAAEGIHVYQRS